MKYRKKPVIVEAVQWKGYLTEEVERFIGDKLVAEENENVHVMGYFIKTLEGYSYMLTKNDWIVKGIQGEFYPCKPDIFEQTYEKISGTVE